MRLLVLAMAVVLVSACKGDDPPKPAAPAAPTPGPVSYTTGDKEFAGDYDGAKALLHKDGWGKWKLYLTKNCPQFSCADVSRDAFGNDRAKATCPQGQILAMAMDKEPTKGSKQPFTTIVRVQGDSAMGLMLSDAKANELEVLSTGETLVAKVNVKTDETLGGTVGARTCN